MAFSTFEIKKSFFMRVYISVLIRESHNETRIKSPTRTRTPRTQFRFEPFGLRTVFMVSDRYSDKCRLNFGPFRIFGFWKNDRWNIARIWRKIFGFGHIFEFLLRWFRASSQKFNFFEARDSAVSMFRGAHTQIFKMGPFSQFHD